MNPKLITHKTRKQIDQENPARGLINQIFGQCLSKKEVLICMFILTSQVGGFAQLYFSPRTDYPVSSATAIVEKGDLNGDNIPDLAIPNGAILSIYLGTGSGTFTNNQNIALGGLIVGIAIRDFNGDNIPDIAAANNLSSVTSILIGTGTGTFNAPQNYTVGFGGQRIVAADFNGDTFIDLAITVFSNSVSVLLGTGLGTFSPFSSYPTGTYPVELVTKDFNSDAKLDLAVCNQNSNDMNILLGNGTGGFSSVQTLSTGANSGRVLSEDFNSDGVLDLVVSNNSTRFSLFTGTGTGTFNAAQQREVGGSGGLNAQDFNGDTKMDLAIGNLSTNSIGIFNGDGTGNFTLAQSIPVNPTPYYFLISDLNNDALLDIVSTSLTTNNFGVLLGVLPPKITSFTPASGPIGTTVTITGTNLSTTPANNIVYFGATRATVTAATTTQLTVTVPTGATYQPITVQVAGLTAYSSSPFLVTFAGGGAINNCTLAPVFSVQNTNIFFGLSGADYDQDGKIDMVVANISPAKIKVYRNTSTPGLIDASSFANPVELTVPSGEGYNINSADLDGDGKIDIIVSIPTTDAVALYRNTSSSGNISFDNPADFVAGFDPLYTSVTDLDADGKPEIVAVNRFSNSISVFKNTTVAGGFTSSSFAPKVDFSVGSEPYTVKIADLNADNKPDIVVSNSVSNTLSIFENTSLQGSINSSSFAPPVTLPTGVLPHTSILTDFDGDGKIDIAVANIFSNTVSVFRNVYSSGPITALSFGSAINFAANTGSVDLAADDMDGDGKVDIVVSNQSTDKISLLKNTSSPGSISFQPHVDFVNGPYPAILFLADIDGDGKPDVLNMSVNSNTVGIFRNIADTTAPTITSFTPSSGPIGTSVTLTGTNFSTPFTNTVKVNAIDATITSSTSTSLTVAIPAGATTGPFDVTIGCNTVTSISNFTVIVAGTIIISPQPTSAAVCDGTTASFHVAASGTTNIAYQWQKVSSEAALLNGLRWDIPSLGPVNVDVDNAVDPTTITTTMGGVSGTTHAVTIRFRGVVETKAYSGGSTNGFWNAGGTPDAFGYNVYELNVSDPPAKYYLNAGVSDLLYCFPIDYQQTINIKAGATIQLKAETRDNKILRNKDQFGNPIIIPGILPAPSAFNGQFIQMDVVAIDGVGYSDIADGGGYSGATSTTLTVNTSGNFGGADYRCKVSGDSAPDVFSNTVTLTINPLPGAPTIPTQPTPLCGPSATINITAAGASIGQYRWYTAASGGTAIAGEVNATYTTPTLFTTTSYYVSINDGTCESSRTSVEAQIITPPAAPTVTGASDFPPAVLTLTASGGTNGQYRWYTTAIGGTALVGEVNGTYTTPSLTTSTTYYVSIDNGQCESSRTPVVAGIKVNSAPVILSTNAEAPVEGIITVSLTALISDPEDNLDFSTLTIVSQPISGARATIEPVNNLVLDYSGISFSGPDRLTIGICDQLAACSQKELTIDVVGDITIYNAISANGDTKNPVFFLKNIDILADTKENKVTIFNRWGDVVYEEENYDNVNRVFRGLNKSGNELPSGTYYYRIEFAGGNETKTGFLALKK